MIAVLVLLPVIMRHCYQASATLRTHSTFVFRFATRAPLLLRPYITRRASAYLMYRLNVAGTCWY